MRNRKARGKSRALAGLASGGFSAGLGSLSRSAQGDQKSTERPLDATRREALGWAWRAGILELEGRTMRVGPPATSVRLWSTAEDAVLGQADHHIRLQLGLGELPHLVGAVQRHYWSGLIGRLAGAGPSDLTD